jgi:hypothetical protein
MFRKLLLIFLSLTALLMNVPGQTVDSTSFSIITRQSFYSGEKEGEVLLHIPSSMTGNHISVIYTTGDVINTWEGRPGRKIVRLPFILEIKPSGYKIEARIEVSAIPQKIYHATTSLTILPHKPNEVKTDRYTGGLIVNKQPFFPFGFYCYSPVYPTLPEEEAVKGFNLISPYQKIIPETLDERKAYMDRCAEIGMKVHYNLLSVSGGGGVGSKIEGLTDEEKRLRLGEEIKMFRDHPALLGWYISDEPNGFKIAPEQLEEIYEFVRKNDPWHPVSIVFMAPFLSSKKYIKALDIVMADPYPVPKLPITLTGDVAEQLITEFKGKRPVWIIPQAFGGGEWWEREPTIQEMRSMTWQAIINGATGIQYFVRQGLNYFPKSTAAWGECGRMAVEVAELTPWLLSDEETLPVRSTSKNILVSSRLYKGQLMIMAVNKINEPVSTSFIIGGISRGNARVLFENRLIQVKGGSISDHLAPFGSQVYIVNTEPENNSTNTKNVNLLIDGSFEDLTSPGLPSACYARPGGDRGATYFLDTRESTDGNHSLRIITPQNNKSLAIRFFPVSVRAGASYTISMWAKSDPERRLSLLPAKDGERLTSQDNMPQYVEILLGEFARARFIPDGKWRQYITFVTIPEESPAKVRTNLILKMPGQGVAWFDEIKILEDR